MSNVIPFRRSEVPAAHDDRALAEVERLQTDAVLVWDETWTRDQAMSYIGLNMHLLSAKGISGLVYLVRGALTQEGKDEL